MKRTLMEILVCPVCKGRLELVEQLVELGDVMEGALRCHACPTEYPIRRGVPRFVESDDYAASFGCEWTWFATLPLDSHNGTGASTATLQASTGWTAADYRGRLVLDAGVGCGRFAEVVAEAGGHVVGVDLSVAIDAAYANVGARDNVHLIQANIFQLPFRHATFDLAYSIGVLHHTPDPAAAFAKVAATVKPGGGLAVSLDDRYSVARHSADFIRKISARLPHRVTLALSALAILYYYPSRIPVVGTVLQLLVPTSMHRDWRWRWLDTFDRYSPTYQWKLLYPEVSRWFVASGFHDISLFDGPIRMRGVKAAATVESRRTLALVASGRSTE